MGISLRGLNRVSRTLYKSNLMAQKKGHEEAEFKAVPEAFILCVNNYDVTGNPSTNSMCQKSFNTAMTFDTVAAPSSILSTPHSFEISLRSAAVEVEERHDTPMDTNVGSDPLPKSSSP